MTDPKILTPAEVAEIKARLEDADVIYFDSIPALCHTIEELRAALREASGPAAVTIRTSIAHHKRMRQFAIAEGKSASAALHKTKIGRLRDLLAHIRALLGDPT